MASDWHAQQGIHNKDTSDFLNTKTPTYIDWEITSLFYSALHMVDSYCDKNQMAPPRNHRERIEFIKNNLPSSYSPYKKLFDLSTKSRYVIGNRMVHASLKIARSCYDAFKSSLPQSG